MDFIELLLVISNQNQSTSKPRLIRWRIADLVLFVWFVWFVVGWQIVECGLESRIPVFALCAFVVRLQEPVAYGGRADRRDSIDSSDCRTCSSSAW